MKFRKYIAYTTHKIVYKLHVSIYKSIVKRISRTLIGQRI